MTMPEGLAFGRPEASPAELAHSDLIGRLAREIYQQGQAASQPFAPTLPAGPQVPQALEGLPQGPGGAPFPSAATGVPSAPAGGQPSGLQPDGSTFAAKSFGGPALGVPGLSGPTVPNLAPASPGFFDVAAIPPVHPASPRPVLPDFGFPSAQTTFPGGPDLHRQVAADHPRANAVAQAIAPQLVPADPSWQGVDVAQESIARTGHLSRTPEAPVSDYYFLKAGPGPAQRAPASPRVEPARYPGPAPRLTAQGSSPVAAPFDVEHVRRDFPALHQSVNGHPLVWLDNAATTHKPQAVIDTTSEFYGRHNSNIHRAAHTLAARSTDLFEGGREAVRRFLNAPSKDDIVFLRGTTEAINLVAHSFGRANIGPGDEIIVSTIEHHANIVPWQLLSQATGATLRAIPVNDRGEIIFEQYAALLSGRTKIVSVTHVANALGTVNPVREIIALAHAYGVPVLVDAAQSSPHMPLDVQALDTDFLVFSGHKVFGPTGVGALYGKTHLLAAMPPWQGGGHMIEDVTFTRTVYKGAPEKFEAGTPDIAGAVGLGAALDYLERIGLPAIAAYEHDLLDYAQAGLAEVKGLRLIGTAREKASVMSFVIEGQENEAVAHHLDAHGIAVRSGHHCALPALRRFGIDQSVRASLAFYNTKSDVDVFLKALHSLPRH
ncbi:family 2A encapsulin nanocompartment cargo protein cysteine desulfurase [Methylobacterium sp. ARG-1]|uniref:family 2A encapsulin nanocompartment cargo protein cysteine desulfurase n=1 Tax=Methylobacterium sp. ARG-1 TaxID=1692501 RepID=UPI000683325F|nr:family 2A encapsulin nanocompartment cargo protein cysteine desulfurase [Methylobacterium sp. ARG-1]KNY19733.1 cysteine desulfurase [Methylobacterium sp. ARG-1]